MQCHFDFGLRKKSLILAKKPKIHFSLQPLKNSRFFILQFKKYIHNRTNSRLFRVKHLRNKTSFNRINSTKKHFIYLIFIILKLYVVFSLNQSDIAIRKRSSITYMLKLLSQCYLNDNLSPSLRIKSMKLHAFSS